MYGNKRQTVELSKQCWECIETIKNVSYANIYMFFLTENMGITQKVIRSIVPTIQGDWLRFKYEGKMVTFSLSNEAIMSYKPKLHEFSFFGSAVKILGAYEYYVRKIAKISSEKIPEKVDLFKNNHKKN